MSSSCVVVCVADVFFLCCCLCSVVFLFCCKRPEVWVMSCSGKRLFFRNPPWVGISRQKQWRKADAAAPSFSTYQKPGIPDRFFICLKSRNVFFSSNAELKFPERSPLHFGSGPALKKYSLERDWLGHEGRQGIFRPFAGISLRQLLSFMRISFTSCWHFLPAVLHGRIRRIFWWVALLVAKNELASSQRKGLNKFEKSLNSCLFCICSPPLCLCFVALSR